MRVIFAALALVATPVALAGSVPEPTILPKPPFPQPARNVSPAGASLALVSSTYRDPATLPPARPAPPAWAPKSFQGEPLQTAIRQGSRLFLLYGPDGASGRHVVGANARTQGIRYAFDFTAFTRPPGNAWFEPVTWAREADGILYVSNSHLTYARGVNRRNAYVSAIDLRTQRTLWRSPALVANARTFVVTDDLIVSGYGFTAEPDFLYLLDRRTGKVLDRLPVPSAPETIKLRGGELDVRTYDHQLVVRIRR